MSEVVQALRQGLGENLVAVVLFGSWARGEAGPESDWDLLVLAHGLKPLPRHFRLKTMLPEAWRGRVSILAKTPSEFTARPAELYLDIALDDVVLYDTDGYITQRLAYLRDLIARHGLRRERIGREMPWNWRQPPGSSWVLEWEDRR
ncbi:MAG: nucleotidyltransferase domain-containing protein [Firmicutes bacterium]|nr:nucleotidyltransferase domain-containing protein [Bacillota bacterium]